MKSDQDRAWFVVVVQLVMVFVIVFVIGISTGLIIFYIATEMCFSFHSYYLKMFILPFFFKLK